MTLEEINEAMLELETTIDLASERDHSYKHNHAEDDRHFLRLLGDAARSVIPTEQVEEDYVTIARALHGEGAFLGAALSALPRLATLAQQTNAIRTAFNENYGCDDDPVERVKELLESEEETRSEARIEQNERHRLEGERDDERARADRLTGLLAQSESERMGLLVGLEETEKRAAEAEAQIAAIRERGSDGDRIQQTWLCIRAEHGSDGFLFGGALQHFAQWIVDGDVLSAQEAKNGSAEAPAPCRFCNETGTNLSVDQVPNPKTSTLTPCFVCDGTGAHQREDDDDAARARVLSTISTSSDTHVLTEHGATTVRQALGMTSMAHETTATLANANPETNDSAHVIEQTAKEDAYNRGAEATLEADYLALRASLYAAYTHQQNCSCQACTDGFSIFTRPAPGATHIDRHRDIAAEAMRAACWEAAQEKMRILGMTSDDMVWAAIKAAIEGAAT